MLRHVEGPDKDWLTFAEVADYLRLGRSTLKELIAAGTFPAGVRHGGTGPRLWAWQTVVSYAHLSPLVPALGRGLPPRPRKSGREKSE
jgi:excisionase family DNA binding protein